MPADIPMDFRKYHGLGNDYIVIDPSELAFEPAPEAVRALCDRNRGIGSDGLLLGPLASGGLDLRIFNPDGSEAAKSGNGLRIFAWQLYERGLRGAEEFPLRARGGRVLCRIADPASKLVRVDMGAPSFEAADLPALAPTPEIVDEPAEFGGRKCRITCVSMGNPHCVVVGLGSCASVAREIGPLVERSPMFPDRANVQFLEPAGAGAIRISIWERGAGFTLASGSSACAAAAAARRLGLAGDEVEVLMPGGCLSVSFGPGGSALLSGPVEKSFEGFLGDDLCARLRAAGGLGPGGPGTPAAGASR